jgi:hypothetical protein
MYRMVALGLFEERHFKWWKTSLLSQQLVNHFKINCGLGVLHILIQLMGVNKGIVLLRRMPNGRGNDHQLVAMILSSAKHSEWGNDWSLLYYSELYYEIIFNITNMKRQLYPNSEYCNCNLISIDVIHVVVSRNFVQNQGIRNWKTELSNRNIYVPVLNVRDTIQLNYYFEWK